MYNINFSLWKYPRRYFAWTPVYVRPGASRPSHTAAPSPVPPQRCRHGGTVCLFWDPRWTTRDPLRLRLLSPIFGKLWPVRKRKQKLKKPEGKFLALCSPLILHRAFLPYVLSSSSLLSCSQTQWFHGLSGDLPSSMTNQPAVLSAEALAPWTTYSFVFLSFLPALLPCPSHPGFPAVLPSNKEYTWHTLKNMPLFVRQANLRYFENINFHH